MKRYLGNTSPEEAMKEGWVIDKGDPGAWECICKAHHNGVGLMKSTKRMKVPGGWIYQVTTEGPATFAESLCFVPAPPGKSEVST